MELQSFMASSQVISEMLQALMLQFCSACLILAPIPQFFYTSSKNPLKKLGLPNIFVIQLFLTDNSRNQTPTIFSDIQLLITFLIQMLRLCPVSAFARKKSRRKFKNCGVWLGKICIKNKVRRFLGSQIGVLREISSKRIKPAFSIMVNSSILILKQKIGTKPGDQRRQVGLLKIAYHKQKLKGEEESKQQNSFLLLKIDKQVTEDQTQKINALNLSHSRLNWSLLSASTNQTGSTLSPLPNLGLAREEPKYIASILRLFYLRRESRIENKQVNIWVNNLLPIELREDDSQNFIHFNINITSKTIIIWQNFTMNTSPSQLPTQLNNQPVHPSKPKIAFTYQPTLPRSSVEHPCPMSPTLVTQKLDLHQKISPVSATNTDKTPRKPGDKENLFISPPRAFETAINNNGQTSQSQYYKKIENSCYKSNISNFCLIQNRNNSPRIVKLPPLSPKLLPKKTQGKCPSFLEKKTKNQQLNLTQMHSDSKQVNSEINQICKCGKAVSHTFSKNQACCSKCAIGKMLEGCQLKPFSTFLQNEELDQKNFSSKSVILNKISSISSENTKVEKFLKEVSEEKQSLQKHCKDNLEGEEHNINLFYKQRKLQLKTHYQKIKSAIKQSIEQDLKELQILEKQQLNEWRKSITVVQSDIKTLQKIEQEIKQMDVHQSVPKLKEELVDQYKEIVKNRKMSKIGMNQAETMNISAISNTNSNNMSSLNVTIVLKCFNINPEVYRPDIYRMVNNNSSKTDRSSRSSDLSSGSQISYPAVCQSPILGPAIQEDLGQKQTPNLHKNVLFSFEGRK